MPINATCDWCGEPIVGYMARLEPGGYHPDGTRVDCGDRLYYHGAEDDDGADSCLSEAMQHATGAPAEAAQLDQFGLEWRLVSEHAPREDGDLQDVPENERVVPDPTWREKMLATPLDYFPALTHQHVRNLKRAGVRSLGDVAERSREELQALPGVGVATAMTATIFLDTLHLRPQVVRDRTDHHGSVESDE